MNRILTLFLAIVMAMNVMSMPVLAAKQTTNVKLVSGWEIMDNITEHKMFEFKVRSTDELKQFFKRYPLEERFEIVNECNEEFFEQKSLLFVFVRYSFDPVRYEVTEFNETATTIEVEIEKKIGSGEGGVILETLTWALMLEMDQDMPEKEIWVNSEKIAETPYKTVKFDDVPDNAWYADAVKYVSWRRNYMTGTGNNMFQPNKAMTRGMLVTVLWRISGEPEDGENVFTDVQEDKYYTEAVNWAAKNGIIIGSGDGKFNPEGEVTREQMVTILHRFYEKRGADVTARADFSEFKDSASVHEYAKEAMQWAVATGVIRGTEKEGTFYLNPQGSSTRAQVAAVFQRWYEYNLQNRY